MKCIHIYSGAPQLIGIKSRTQISPFPLITYRLNGESPVYNSPQDCTARCTYRSGLILAERRNLGNAEFHGSECLPASLVCILVKLHD